MATLPDLDAENDAGFIAYYKVDGTPDIENFISNTDIQEYTIYDNGVTGTLRRKIGSSDQPGVLWRFRIKTDGWFVIYMPQDGYNSDLYAIPASELDDDDPGTTMGLYTYLGIKNAATNFSATKSDTNGVTMTMQNFCSRANVTGPGSFSEIGVYDYNEPNADSLAILREARRDTYNTQIGGTVTLADVSEIHIAHSFSYTKNEYIDIDGTRYLDGTGIVGIDLKSEGIVSSGDSFDVGIGTDHSWGSIFMAVYYTP